LSESSLSHGLRWLATHREAVLLAFGCPEEVQVGWCVSEVQAAFVANLADSP
jgi:hypothetical protein